MKNLLNFLITFFSVLIITAAGIFVGFAVPLLFIFLLTGGKDDSGGAGAFAAILTLFFVPSGLIIGSIFGFKISRKLKLK